MVAQGLVGMVTDDHSGRALVLPINIIANFFREKGLPWGLNGAPQTSVSAQPTPTTATNAASGFRVTEAFLRAVPDAYKGDCPIVMRFVGRISAVGGSGTVSYQFVRSDNGPGPSRLLKFGEPGTKLVETSQQLGEPGKNFSGWQEIEVLDPSQFKSDHASFSIECAPALPANVVSVKISNASCSKIGDGAFRVEMSGDATSPDNAYAYLWLLPSTWRPNSSTRWDVSCGAWNDISSGLFRYCQRSANQPLQTKWALIGTLHDQQATVPTSVFAYLDKGSPGNTPLVILAHDGRTLVCQ
jgi:hypothetical protein